MDKEKEELFGIMFKERAYPIAGLPDFEIPIIHIHKEQVPSLNHSDDALDAVVYALMSWVDVNTQKVNDEMLKKINETMLKNGITDYYGINEQRLIEIVEEARAFEVIKKTFSLRQAVLNICDKPSKVMPNRKKFVKEILTK